MLVAGCGKQPPAFKNLDITGNTQFASDFSLPDTSGKIRTMADYKGKVVVLFFGYTHCPDVCPTTMAELSQALQQLGPEDAKRVQVLFVTVDPERDTPTLLAQYVPAFNPTFVGLRPADEPQLAKIAKDFRVYYAKVPGKTPDSYTMDHTAASYVFDHARQAASVRARRPGRHAVGARYQVAARLIRSKSTWARDPSTRPFSTPLAEPRPHAGIGKFNPDARRVVLNSVTS